jgi:hypothetical protein
MRLLPNIRYGADPYPEAIARRLRALNITAWIMAALGAGFALTQLLDPAPGLWKAGVLNHSDLCHASATPPLWSASGSACLQHHRLCGHLLQLPPNGRRNRYAVLLPGYYGARDLFLREEPTFHSGCGTSAWDPTLP